MSKIGEKKSRGKACPNLKDLNTKSLDIQYAAIRLVRFYLEDFVNLKGSVLDITEDVNTPDWFSSDDRPFLKETKFKHVMLSIDPKKPHSPDISKFFDESMKFKNDQERENLFWRINLRYPADMLCQFLISISQQLQTLHGHSHFVAKIIEPGPNGKIEEINVPFNELKFYQFHVRPKEVFLYTYLGVGPEISGYKYSNALSYLTLGFTHGQRKLIFSIASMGFGVRGRRGEIVGTMEDLDSFTLRFPGEIVNYEVKELDDEGLKAREFIHNPVDLEACLVKKFMRNFTKGDRWCVFCGTYTSIPVRCPRCKGRCYCGKKCLSSDWNFHRITCKNKSH